MEWDALTPPARRELNAAVFDAIGLTVDEREAVYAGVTKLMENRRPRIRASKEAERC